MPSKRNRQPSPKLFWQLQEILDAVRYDHPDWPEERVREKAREIHLGLHTFDERTRRHNRRIDKFEVLAGLNPTKD